MNTARQNAKASAALGEALFASLRANKEEFGECPIATDANRLGRAPKQSSIPATGASSLYNSTLTSEARKR